MVRQGIIQPVQPGGATNASPVVGQRKKSGELRLCVNLKVHINGKVMDEDYPIPDVEKSSTTYMGPRILAKFTSQMPTSKIELDEVAKDIFAINTSQGLLKMCRLPQGLKTSSSIFQNCIESTLKGNEGVVIFQDDVLVNGITKEQFDKRMIAVKSQLREKNLTNSKKKSNSKPVDSVSFFGILQFKDGSSTRSQTCSKNKKCKSTN